MSIFKYLTLSHLRKTLAAIETRFLSVDDKIDRTRESIISSLPKGTFVVHVTEEYDLYYEGYVFKPDKTFDEIYQAIINEENVVCELDGGYICYLFEHNSYHITFTADSYYSDSWIYASPYISISKVSNIAEVYYPEPIRIPDASNSSPLPNGTANAGVYNSYARWDHVHPTDTTRASVSDVLTKSNTTAYTPTANYHPATKKYVDDSITDATSSITITTTLSELDDTYIDDLLSGQVLTYNSTYSKWENTTLPIYGGEVGDDIWEGGSY